MEIRPHTRGGGWTMRTVTLAWNTEIPDAQMVKALQGMFTTLRGKPVVMTVGKGVAVNGLPLGHIYVETPTNPV